MSESSSSDFLRVSRDDGVRSISSTINSDAPLLETSSSDMATTTEATPSARLGGFDIQYQTAPNTFVTIHLPERTLINIPCFKPHESRLCRGCPWCDALWGYRWAECRTMQVGKGRWVILRVDENEKPMELVKWLSPLGPGDETDKVKIEELQAWIDDAVGSREAYDAVPMIRDTTTEPFDRRWIAGLALKNNPNRLKETDEGFWPEWPAWDPNL